MKINKKQFMKWLEALWSGDYEQGRGALMQQWLGGTFSYCCLGVACKILIPRNKQSANSSGRLYGGFAHSQSHAPEWLKNISIDFCHKTGRTLVELNDDLQLSFDEIADLLYAVYILKIKI